MPDATASQIHDVTARAAPPETPAGRLSRKPRWDLSLLLLLASWGTCAFFWQSRDWNNASRLMLTYAIVDRGTLHIDGLQMHAGDMESRTGDLAVYDGHFYTEKAPGQSLLGVPVYALWKWSTGYAKHPLDVASQPYWVQDYWVTLFTSGLCTALIVVLLYTFSVRLGTCHGDAVLLALAAGLGTHGLVYGTLFYGHQPAALALLAAFYLIATRRGEGHTPFRLFRDVAAGIAAGFGVVIELPLLPVAALLALEVLRRERALRPVLVFGAGALASLCALFWYHWAAFGDPLTFGYRHIWDPTVRQVHEGVGLFGPNWSVLPELLWRPRRGLFVYAPVTLLSIAALGTAGWKRRWDLCLFPGAGLAVLLLVNVSHFYWAGGVSTGPRFLLPAVPLLMLPVAGWLGARRSRGWTLLSLRAMLAALSILGAVVALSCALAGGRFGPVNQRATGEVAQINPLASSVFPALRRAWVGGAPDGPRLARTVAGELLHCTAWQQIGVLAGFLVAILGLLFVRCRGCWRMPANSME